MTAQGGIIRITELNEWYALRFLLKWIPRYVSKIKFKTTFKDFLGNLLIAQKD